MTVISESDIRHSLSLVTSLHVGRWGNELVVEGFDDPLTRRQVRLVFRDCREIRWSNYEVAPSEIEADVVGLCVGQSNYREPALITTDLFELSVLYGSCEVEPIPVRRNGIGALDSVA